MKEDRIGWNKTQRNCTHFLFSNENKINNIVENDQQKLNLLNDISIEGDENNSIRIQNKRNREKSLTIQKQLFVIKSMNQLIIMNLMKVLKRLAILYCISKI